MILVGKVSFKASKFIGGEASMCVNAEWQITIAMLVRILFLLLIY